MEHSHTIGAKDGKHITQKAPKYSSTVYHNYKLFFIIIHLALVDVNYKFLKVDAGANGSTSDRAVFSSEASCQWGTVVFLFPLLVVAGRLAREAGRLAWGAEVVASSITWVST